MKIEPGESYDEDYTQVSVVPFRIGDDGPELCLITTRRSGRWGFPKGYIHDHDCSNSAALSEAHEEAGLIGEIVGDPLGFYKYSKRGGTQSVKVSLMHVTDCIDDFKESAERERAWLCPKDAAKALDRPNLLNLLQVALTRIGADVQNAETPAARTGRP